MFYTYTEEGAMREDPEKANKKSKKKKTKRGIDQHTSKRPLTAKKKAENMMKGDIVSMVETLTNAQSQTKTESKEKKAAKFYPKAKGIVKE